MTYQMFKAEVREELLSVLREPTALFFSVLMPVAFFALFVFIFGTDNQGGLQAIATYGTFGTLGVVMMNPGISWAASRERGWMRVKRVSGVPMGVTVAAKVAGALPYAVGVLLALTATAIATGTAEWDTVTVIRIVGVLLVGSMPFALISLAVGALAGPNATTAILNAILLPLVVVSGLWFPLEIMPDVIGEIARFVPVYHLSQLANAQVTGAGWLDHAVVLAATGAAGAVAALVAYRSTRA